MIPRLGRRIITLTILATILANSYGVAVGERRPETPAPQHYDTQFMFDRQLELFQAKLDVDAAFEKAQALEVNETYQRHTDIVSRGGPRDMATFPLLLPEHVQDSGITAEQLDSVFADTPLSGLGTACKGAEKKWRIRADALCAIAIHESGWGKSKLARERNNIFGFGAPSNNPDLAVWFSSKAESVDEAAGWLTAQYLTPDAHYYRDGTLATIGPIWAEDGWADGDPSWAWKVSDIWTGLIRHMNKGE